MYHGAVENRYYYYLKFTLHVRTWGKLSPEPVLFQMPCVCRCCVFRWVLKYTPHQDPRNRRLGKLKGTYSLHFV